MRRSLTMLGVAVLAAVPMLLGFTAPAGARTTAPKFATAAAARPAAIPNTNLKGKAAALAFKPAKLKAAWSGPPPVQACTAAVASFTITNTTKKTVQVTYQGAAFGNPIPKGAGIYVCGWGTGKATLVLGVSGSAHTLTAKFS